MERRFVNVGEWIQERLGAHPGRIALAYRTRYRLLPVTYRELDGRVARCRRVFLDRGLRRGERVILLGPNSIDWATAWIACVQSGLVAVPLDSQTPEELVKTVLGQTKASLILTDRPLGQPAKTLFFDELRGLLSTASGEPPAPATVGRDELLEIIYTSGTTGAPKGVMLTHANLLANLEGLLARVRLPFAFRFLSTLPLSHMLEQVLGLLFPLSQGCCVIYPYTVWPSRLRRMIRDHGVHAMITVPGLMKAMKELLESGGQSPRRALGWRFRLIGVGGASLSEELESWWTARGVRVVQGYGLTETGPLISLNTPLRARRGSVGRPLPGALVKLAEDSEILVKGANASPGYYGKPEETAKLYAGGWLKTGDIGELKDGWLYFRGRSKDVIVTSSGLNVYPDDVEAALNAVPGVKDSCVLQWRDKVWAVLLLGSQAQLQRIIETANAGLMPHQKIGGATPWPLPDFPRTRMGKAKKFEVLERLGQIDKKERTAAPSASASRLEEVVARALGTDRVTPAAKLSDLGMDSLARMALLSEVDQEFGVEIEEASVTGRTTVGQLAEMIAKTEQPPPARLPRWQFSRPSAVPRPVLRWLPERIALALARPQGAGLENLRGLKGPVIFAVNHQSAWDAAVVRRFLPRELRRLAIPALPDFYGYYGTDRPLWQRAAYRGMGLFISLCYQGYPFGPAVGTERSFEQTGRLLDRGYNVMIFPEGGRTPDGKIHPFLAGVGVLAREMAAPVVPVRISGMREMLPFPRFVVPKRLGRARVVFGGPLRPRPGLTAPAAAEEIRKAVEALA